MAAKRGFARPAGSGWPAGKDKRRKEMQMTLSELSGQYRAGAEALRARALDLEGRRQGEADEAARRLLDGRIRLLRAMWRGARELAALCEHHSGRGDRRSGRYTP